MDVDFTLCLELTYEFAHNTYITCVDYCSPNRNITLLTIVREPQFATLVVKARKQAGFPFCCVLVGIRDLGFKRL